METLWLMARHLSSSSSLFIIFSVIHLFKITLLPVLCFNSKNVCSVDIKFIYMYKIIIDMHWWCTFSAALQLQLFILTLWKFESTKWVSQCLSEWVALVTILYLSFFKSNETVSGIIMYGILVISGKRVSTKIKSLQYMIPQSSILMDAFHWMHLMLNWLNFFLLG